MAVESYCNDVVRRMVGLPRSILGGFSRALDQGMDLMRIGGRRNPPHRFLSDRQNHQQQDHYFSTNDVQQEWAFLACFEQQFGTAHPFYACRFVEASKMARDEHKFVFVYLHSPDHPFTASFCRDTLCSEVVVQFLDANFVCWGAIADRGEGLHLAAALRPDTFPFCAVVAPASGDTLAVLQQMEGPVSPAEMLAILERTMEEQGSAFGSGRAKEEERRRADHRLREEQDVAYFASLRLDQEKERTQKQGESSKLTPRKPDATVARKAQPTKDKLENAISSAQPTQILIRFPNGERREKSFLCTDKVQAIYRYIDSLGIAGLGDGNYKLVSSFPRKVYGVDQMRMSLRDAGFHPKATLFLELV